jgi:protein gp37
LNTTGIKWTEKTWNPVTGCQAVSEGCRHCYAKRIAEDPAKASIFPKGFGLSVHPSRLNQPKHLPEPSLIFVNSMSDLFWDKVPVEFVDKVMDVIDSLPQHRFQVLTKRPQRMADYSRQRPLPRNVWAGTSIENQKVAGRLDSLLQVQGAGVRFISAEPLLGTLELNWGAVDWVIVGGESGPHLNDADVCLDRGLVTKFAGRWLPRDDERYDWVRSIRDGCVTTETAFFFKQWGGPWSGAAGNELDGRTWEQYPADMPCWPTKAVTPVTTVTQLPLL